MAGRFAFVSAVGCMSATQFHPSFVFGVNIESSIIASPLDSCNGVPYDPSKSSCCTTSNPPQVYDNSTQKCDPKCNVISSSDGCCLADGNPTPFDQSKKNCKTKCGLIANSDSCCVGHGKPTPFDSSKFNCNPECGLIANDGVGCCGSTTYNRKTQGCCNVGSTATPTVYDSGHQFCCHHIGNQQIGNWGTDQCCNTTFFKGCPQCSQDGTHGTQCS